MSQLGDRFLNERKDESNALLCYMLAKNATKSMQIFRKQLEALPKNSKQFKTKLVKLIKVSLILYDLCQVDIQFEEDLDYLALQLAYKAIAQQQHLVAYHALQATSGSCPKIQKLKDLLYNGHHHQVTPHLISGNQPLL